MKTTRLTPHRINGGAVLLALALAACASAPQPDIPAALKPPTSESLAMIVAARGVQIYECRVRKEGAGYEWAFVAPEAELLDAQGRSVGRHGAGPSWQANDGSRVVGSVKERASAPIAGAVPWLLVQAKSAGPEGTFSSVTSIQRVNTAGGVAPTGGCAEGTAGKTARVAYSADYYLYSR
jgi:hypothetical protein